jgi:prevent-host-death family protein
MAEVGIRALKQNASAVVRRVAAGESVTITDRGRPVVRMVPTETDRIEALIASGLARPALRPRRELATPVRPRQDGPRPSDVLEEMRETERY